MTLIIDPGCNRVVAGDMGRYFQGRAAHYKREQEQNIVAVAGSSVYVVTVPKRGIADKHYACAQDLATTLNGVSERLVSGLPFPRVLAEARIENLLSGFGRNIFFSMERGEFEDSFMGDYRALAVSDRAVAVASLQYLRTLESFLKSYREILDPPKPSRPSFSSQFAAAAQTQSFDQEKVSAFPGRYGAWDRRGARDTSNMNFLDYEPFATRKSDTDVPKVCPGMLQVWNEAFDYLLRQIAAIESRYPDMHKPGFVVEGKDYFPY